MTKVRSTKAEDRKIDAIYRQHCTGMQIDVMRFGALFKMARTALAAGETDHQIGARMVAFLHREG